MRNEICIIAGEISGDLQASSIVFAINEEVAKCNIPSFHFWGIAGPHLREAGVEAVHNSEDLAVMGFSEIVKSLYKIEQIFSDIVMHLERRKPLAIILVDYPGFNLKLAKIAWTLGIIVIYHIPPKVWAHGKKRIIELREYCHLCTCIFEFEHKFLFKNGINSKFIGNPLKDKVKNYRDSNLKNKSNNVDYTIAILPGSRKSEINKLFSIQIKSFIELQKECKEQKILARIPVSPNLSENYLINVLKNQLNMTNDEMLILLKNISFEKNNMYDILNNSDYAWVCSGTAVLEVAFFAVPMSVMYKVSALSAFIMKHIVTTKYISLVNLCADKLIYPEFLQKDVNVKNLVSHAKEILFNADKANAMKEDLEIIYDMFGEWAAKNCANEILQTITDYVLGGDYNFCKFEKNMLSMTEIN